MKKEFIFVIVVAVVVILLAAVIVVTGFNSDLTKDKENQTTADKLRIGYLPTNGHALIFVAQEEGYFAEENLDVELFAFQNSAEGINAIIANKIDIGGFGPSPLVYASKGAEVTVVGGLMGEGAGVIVKPENADKYKSLEDYKGKTIATVRMSSGDIFFRGVFSNAGIDIKEDLTIQEIESPAAVLEAVKSGKVDAGIVWTPYMEMAESQGLKVIAYSEEYYPKHPCCRIAVLTDNINTDRDSYVKMLKSLIRSYKFIHTNPDEAVDDVSNYVKVDKSILKEAMTNEHSYLSPDPNRQGVLTTYELLKSIGYIEDNGVDMNDHIDVTLYGQALDEILTEYPDDEYYLSMKADFNNLDK
ncbi:ABC transporter substrate-binding protein [Methanomicrobium antiquum]|uniref:ABC transporter substrate-binding protein n=1 Tax=Methanomicrobium antiquum TaxID=487686 RepID=A0AAF0FPE5_9EURY|nr:ABC transporter substrate-binding protein [Methanomicrobium antiquum]WFN37230.1 ABC transporter substrate-binding protein [Methanomicrobium antiquum]